MLIDRFGRKITYLRVSVTDRCNLRCVYCVPPEGFKHLPHESILRYEEIARIVSIAAEQGVRSVRLTGGDPLVRLDLERLVEMIARIPQIEDLSLTTNGLLLERAAQRLKDAGLRRINVSLDTLDAGKFARITRGGSLEAVWRGLEAAESAGLAPLKINVVAMKGVNDGELEQLARLTQLHPWHVRFIELMPVSNQQPWGVGFPAPEDAFLSIADVKAILSPLQLEPAEGSLGAGEGPARLLRIPSAAGRIGFIAPLSEHFCAACNRMRLTADGAFRPCLLWDDEIHFLNQMRAGEDVLPFLRRAVESKPAGHDLAQNHAPSGRTMRQIGG